MKKLLLVSLICLLIFSFAITGLAKVKLVFWEYPYYVDIDKENGWHERRVIEEFEALYPNVEIELQMLPWSDGPKKVAMAIATGDTPNILNDCDMRIMSYVAAGAMVDLEDTMDAEERADFFPDLLERVTYNGKVYMYLAGQGGGVMSVNKIIAEKAGALDLLPLDREDRSWTTEEFKKFALKVAEAKIPNTDVFGLHFADANNQQYYIMFMHQAFGAVPFVVEDGKYRCTINSPEGIEGLEFYLDLYNTPGVGLPGPESQGINYINDYWYTGKLAILMGGNVVTLTKQMRDPIVAEVVDGLLVGIPRVSADMANIYVSSISGFSVFKSTPEKEKYSKLFAEFFITRPYFWETTLKGNPPRNATYDPDSPFFQTCPYDRSITEIDYALNGMAGLWQSVDYGTLCPLYNQYRETYAATMQGVFIGELTPKEGLDIVADKINKLLDEFYEENP